MDFIKVKNNEYNSSITYMLNYPCFEKIAMNSDSDNSESVRIYFSELRKFIYDNQSILYQSMINYDDLKKLYGYDVIYFFVVDKNIIIFSCLKLCLSSCSYFLEIGTNKIGRSINILQRLRNYNVGKINEIDLKYLVVVKNSVIIEKCIKNNLLDKQLFDKKEIYKIKSKKFQCLT